MSWAAGTVYLKWARLEGDPMAITIWQLVFGVAVIAICVPVFEGTLHLNADARSLFGLIYSGIIGSGLCYFLWFGIVRRLPASTAALGILASPVIGDHRDDRARANVRPGMTPSVSRSCCRRLRSSCCGRTARRKLGGDPAPSVKEHECVHPALNQKTRLTGRAFLPIRFEFKE